MQQHARQEALQSTVILCCVCGEARDDIATEAGDGRWGSLKSYLKKYGIPGSMALYSHTFCPTCYVHYKRMFGLEAEKTGERRRS